MHSVNLDDSGVVQQSDVPNSNVTFNNQNGLDINLHTENEELSSMIKKNIIGLKNINVIRTRKKFVVHILGTIYSR